MKIKNIFKTVLISLLWTFFLSHTYAIDYEYKDLEITANVLIDWTINVKEDYLAEFYTSKHGIIRSIPEIYSVNGQWFRINISNIDVKWHKFNTSKNNWELSIKIWDPDKYVYWKVSYPISYTVYWLIRNFSGMWYAELYWNIVGYDFDTDIRAVTATINLPKAYTWFKSSDFLITTDWKAKTVEEFKWKVDWSAWNKIKITYYKWLPAYNWITLAIKFPNNYFQFDDKKQSNLLTNVKQNTNKWNNKSSSKKESWESAVLLMVIVSFIIMPIIIIASELKEKRNKITVKNCKLRWEYAEMYKVIVQYTPPKWLNSAEVWLLLHRKWEMKDLFSLIYKRAAEWLIKINWGVWNYALYNIVIKKIKDIPESAPEFEKQFFKNFMDSDEKSISTYQKNHSKDLENLTNHGIEMWWFKWKPKNKHNITWLIFIIIMISCIISWITDNPDFFFYAFTICTIIIPIAGIINNWKLKETEKWAELIAHILWFGQFLIACEEKQLKVFLERDPLYFDKVLPYAVAMWIDTEFMEKIRPILKENNINPTWCDCGLDNMNTLLNGTNHASDSCTSYMENKWFSWWSSFDSDSGGWGGFSSWWWGGWGGWRSR